jgi:Uncharacterized protein conserved in bacteria
VALTGLAPSAEDIEALARAAFAALPPAIREAAAGLVIRVEELADEETVEALGLEDPFELTGLYDGVALTEKSVEDVATGRERGAPLPPRDPRGMDRPGRRALGQAGRPRPRARDRASFRLDDEEIAAIDPWWE